MSSDWLTCWQRLIGGLTPPRKLCADEKRDLDRYVGRWLKLDSELESKHRHGDKARSSPFLQRDRDVFDEQLELLMREVDAAGLRQHWIQAVLKVAPPVESEGVLMERESA